MARMTHLLALCAMEGTYGTFVAPSATVAADVLLFRDVDVSGLDAELVERPRVMPFHGVPQRAARHSRSLGLSGTLPLPAAGAAGTAPPWRRILRACGMAETITAGTRVDYTPISAGQEGASLQFFVDGSRHEAAGARGTFSLNFTAGEEPTLNASLQSVVRPQAAATFPASPAFTGWPETTEVRNGNSTLTVGGQTLPFRSVGYTHGNQLQQRDIPARREVRITGRTPTLDLLVEAPDGFSPIDFYDLASSGALTALNLVHGVGAGNIVELTCGQIQIMPGIRNERDGDVQMLRMQARAHPTAAGNDEVLIRVR
jgi:hypothetical protein